MSEEDRPVETPPEYFTDMPVGEILRRGREHFGQTLEEVEKNLRIRAIQLHALETGNLEQLPGKAYALGFVRSYSEYLGLDGDKMVYLFKRQSVGNKIEPHLNFPVPAADSKIPAISLAVICALIGLVFVGMWMSDRDAQRDDVNDIPAVEDMVDQEDISVFGPVLTEENAKLVAENLAKRQSSQGAGQNGGDAASEPATASETEEDGIILNVIENSWVEIRDSKGKAIVSRVLKAGDQYFVPDRPDLRMSLGNASGVQIVVDGKALPVLGQRGEVKRNISLESKALKALAAPQE